MYGYISKSVKFLPWQLCLLTVILLSLAEPASASREVSEKRECSTCHIMWLKDFNRKDVTTLIPFEPKPVTKSGKQDVSSTNRMCFSCHDGFILDSRPVWSEGKHNHPVGIKPSKKITIPTSKGKVVFPLNEDGKVYCGTCHTAHGVDWNQEESPVFLRVKNVESSMCLACHLEKSTGPKEGNHPLFAQPPHNPVALMASGARFAADGGVICQSCHQPHGSANSKMLVSSNQDSKLCTQCHRDKEEIGNSKHDLQVMAPDSKNRRGQHPDQSGPCGSCHVPHGGDGAMLWARNRGDSQDRAAARCLSCHSEGGIAGEKLTGIHSHPLQVSLADLPAGKDGKPVHSDLPLYDSQGHKTDRNGRVSCGSCHDPHRWSPDPQQAKPADPKEAEGGHESSFLRVIQGEESGLCLTCHQDKRSILETRHHIKTGADRLPGGVCGQCHRPHNALGSALRARDRPVEKGSLSRLCLDCHREGGLAEEKSLTRLGHPLGVSLKNIKQNSHLPLFNKQGEMVTDKGLVDCSTCHNAHQWDPSDVYNRQPTDAEKEGHAGSSFLRISAADDARLCLDCHGNKQTLLGTDHDMRVTAPQSVNSRKQDVAHSGVCGQCHAVHNPEGPAALWGREPAKVSGAVEQMCQGCHDEGQVAEKKRPVALRHPDHVKLWSTQVRQKRLGQYIPDIPVYDEQGRKAHVGLITCLSCHDPHQWDPARARSGTGRNLEGDAMNSFLRNSNTELIICADCHGEDAIFRYKYFHGKTSRKEYPLYQ